MSELMLICVYIHEALHYSQRNHPHLHKKAEGQMCRVADRTVWWQAAWASVIDLCQTERNKLTQLYVYVTMRRRVWGHDPFP